ncbi:hypothetical protein [Leptospira yanagawae]
MGAAKIVGCIGIVFPNVRRLKEWSSVSLVLVLMVPLILPSC